MTLDYDWQRHSLSEKLYEVRTTDGVLLDRFFDAPHADLRRDVANSEAIRNGYSVRYVTVDRSRS